jgi:hypothetical protein
MSFCIDRCLCFNKTFSELLVLAESTGIKDLEKLQEIVTFGKKCQLCHPYIREALKTGETSFDRIILTPTEK